METLVSQVDLFCICLSHHSSHSGLVQGITHVDDGEEQEASSNGLLGLENAKDVVGPFDGKDERDGKEDAKLKLI